MPAPPQWPICLDRLVHDPPPDTDERKRIADIVRDEIESLQRAVEKSQRAGAALAQGLAGSTKAPMRPREVLLWRRGGSLSFQFQKTDTAWAEDLHTTTAKVVRTLRFRPSDPQLAAEKLPQGKACRGHVAIVDPDENCVEPGDWIAAVRARNMGGASGMQPIVTFGTTKFAPVGEEEDPSPVPDDEEDLG